MACWAYTKPESDLYQIFGDHPVPIRSIVPVIPREEGCPLCYMVIGWKLPDEQLAALSYKLYNQWQPECVSVAQARGYILEGLPLQTCHFSNVGTDDYFMIPHGAAFNIYAQLQEDGIKLG